jgi:DNA-binding response OmpR family regulator
MSLGEGNIGYSPAISVRYNRGNFAAIAPLFMPQLILVVDDEFAIAELVRLYLSEAGYEVVTAATGRAALEKIALHRPDLILLDLMLPDIDGFSVCEILRSSKATASIPIVITSVWRSAGSRRLGQELGALDYLTKPFRPDQLIDRVKRTLAGQAVPAVDEKHAKAGVRSAPKRRRVLA